MLIVLARLMARAFWRGESFTRGRSVSVSWSDSDDLGGGMTGMGEVGLMPRGGISPNMR
jgi:hypothetical protein